LVVSAVLFLWDFYINAVFASYSFVIARFPANGLRTNVQAPL
jgi:hypothetical protein